MSQNQHPPEWAVEQAKEFCTDTTCHLNSLCGQCDEIISVLTRAHTRGWNEAIEVATDEVKKLATHSNSISRVDFIVQLLSRLRKALKEGREK